MFHKHPLLSKWLAQHSNCSEIVTSPNRKFCKNCRYHKTEQMSFSSTVIHYCRRNSEEKDSVKGEAVPLYCDGERDEGACGPSGKFFEPCSPPYN